MKREYYLDNLKAFSMIMIVFVHSKLQTYLPAINPFIQSWSVAVYFVISGVLLRKKYHSATVNYNASMWKQKARVYLTPYVVFCVLYVLELFVLRVPGGMEDALRYLAQDCLDIITFNGKGAMWFLSAFLFAELIFLAQIKKFKIVEFSTINGLLTLGGLWLTRFPLPHLSLVLFRILIAIFLLNVGYLYELMKETRKIRKWTILAISTGIYLVTFIIQGNTCTALMGTGTFPLLYGIEIATGSIMMLQIFELFLNEKKRVLSDFGGNTIYVLTTHQILLEIIYIVDRFTVDMLRRTGKIQPILLLILVMIIEIGIIIPFCKKYLGFLFGKIKVTEKGRVA